MRKCLIILVLMAVCFSAYSADLPSEWYRMSRRGERESATITNQLTAFGSRSVRWLFDGGPWTITNNFTIPTNITLAFTEGSYWDVTTNYTATLSGCPLLAGDYRIHSGWGSVTGDPQMIYRWPSWGDTNYLRIGRGVLGSFMDTNTIVASTLFSVLTNQSYVMAPGSYVGFDNLYANNFTSLLAEVQDLIVNGDGSIESNFNVNGIDHTPQGNYTCSWTTATSSQQMQDDIDGIHKYIPMGKEVYFNFSDGTYNMTNELQFYGFYGAGLIYIQATNRLVITNHANQTVILDFSGAYDATGTDDGIAINRCIGPRLFVRNLRFANATSVCVEASQSINLSVSACSFTNAHKGSAPTTAAIGCYGSIMGADTCDIDGFTYGIQSGGYRSLLYTSDLRSENVNPLWGRVCTSGGLMTTNGSGNFNSLASDSGNIESDGGFILRP